MKSQDLNNYFSGVVPAIKLSELIAENVSAYRFASQKTGSVRNVVFDDDREVKVGCNELELLGNSYLKGTLSEWDIFYISDALLLGRCTVFESENIKEAFEEMTDPEINGPLTDQRMVTIIKSICGGVRLVSVG